MVYYLVTPTEDTLQKNIEFLSIASKSYEIMTTLKKINTYLAKKEFNEEKLNEFTSNLYDIVNKMYAKKKYDPVIIPYILELYKKVFQKQLKASNQQDKTKNPKQKSQKDGDNLKFKNPVEMQKNTDILISFFKLSLLFLDFFDQLPEKINIAILSFMHKFLDEGIPIIINNVKKMVCLIHLIHINKFKCLFLLPLER